MLVPEETQTHQLENEPTCSQNVAAGTNENQRLAHSNSSALNRHRLVLTNKTNNGYSHSRPFVHHNQTATGMRNVQNEREKVSRKKFKKGKDLICRKSFNGSAV
jgi:hypothetical protein